MESLRLYFIWYIFDIITISMIYSIPSMPGIRTWNADQHVRSTSRLGSLWSRPDPHPSFRRKARSRHKMWRGFPYSRRRNTCPWLTTLICPQVLRWNGICQSVIFFFFSFFPKPYYFAQHPAGRSGETAGIVVWSIPLFPSALFFVAGNSALS